jgi:hypothetical protein
MTPNLLRVIDKLSGWLSTDFCQNEIIDKNRIQDKTQAKPSFWQQALWSKKLKPFAHVGEGSLV